MAANDENGNVEHTAEILTFPTEQRRVAVATERQDGNLFTPDELSELISQFVDVDFSDINVTIDNYENSIQYSFEELADNEFKISPDDAKNFFSKKDDKSVYTECLEAITELLVCVHTLNGQSQDGTLDEVKHQIKDIVRWLHDRSS
jgi:hypothetical protein